MKAPSTTEWRRIAFHRLCDHTKRVEAQTTIRAPFGERQGKDGKCFMEAARAPLVESDCYVPRNLRF
jgi:hypothetical protein